MSEENKARFREFVDEVINKRNVDAIENVLTENYAERNPMPPGIEPGREGMKQAMSMHLAAFPDLQSTVDDVIAEGDKVVGRVTARDTHQAELMGIPATGKHIEIFEIHIFRIENGLAVEHWGIEDQMDMMQQLGVIPIE